MASTDRRKPAIPFSLKLSAPKKLTKNKPDAAAIKKLLEKINQKPDAPSESTSSEKPAEADSDGPKREQLPAPPSSKPKMGQSPPTPSTEGKNAAPISFSIGMEKKRVSKIGTNAKRPELPAVVKNVILPPPIEESWKNGDVAKVEKEKRPSYLAPKKREPKEKSEGNSDSGGESKRSSKSKGDGSRDKSSHSSRKDRHREELRDRHKDKHKEKHQDKHKEKHQDKHKDKHKHKHKHKHKDRSPEPKSPSPHFKEKEEPSDSKSHSTPKPPKRKFRPIHKPPPINFQELLKLAEQKQSEVVNTEPVLIPKKKPEGRPKTQEELDRAARRKTKEYQDWLKYGTARPTSNADHSLSPDRSPYGSDASSGDHEPSRAVERGLAGRNSTLRDGKQSRDGDGRKKFKPAPKPQKDHSQDLVESLFSEVVHLGSTSSQKSSKPDRPDKTVRQPVGSSAENKETRDSRQDGSGRLPADRRGEKRPLEASCTRDASAAKQAKLNPLERHGGLKNGQSLGERGPPGSSKERVRLEQNGGPGAPRTKGSTSHPDVGMKSVPKDRQEMSGIPGKHRESASVVKGAGFSLPGSKPLQTGRPDQGRVGADSRGSIPGASRPLQSAPRIIDCSPQSPPRKAPKLPSAGEYSNPFDRAMSRVKKNNPKPVLKKKPIIESDEEEDSDLEDFIDDGEDAEFEESEVSKAIRSVFNYDRSRYLDDDDDDLADMETSFARQMAEEKRSMKLGLKEDLEEERREEERRRFKMFQKKKTLKR